jgi:hypothetical protein
MFRAIETCLTALRVRYAEPHRAYHTQAHVDAMLASLQELGETIVHPAAVELAIWYHDAVYDPAAADNEARSADLLRAELDNLAAPVLLDHAELLVSAPGGKSFSYRSPIRAMATSVARCRSVRDRSPSPMTRLKRLMSASTSARQL